MQDDSAIFWSVLLDYLNEYNCNKVYYCMSTFTSTQPNRRPEINRRGIKASKLPFWFEKLQRTTSFLFPSVNAERNKTQSTFIPLYCTHWKSAESKAYLLLTVSLC